jgi:hypothetical protein
MHNFSLLHKFGWQLSQQERDRHDVFSRNVIAAVVGAGTQAWPGTDFCRRVLHDVFLVQVKSPAESKVLEPSPATRRFNRCFLAMTCYTSVLAQVLTVVTGDEK